MYSSTEVEFSVDLCAAQLVEEVVTSGIGYPILSSNLVEVTEVHTESQGAIPFLREEDWGTAW